MPTWPTERLIEMLDRGTVPIATILEMFNIDPVEARAELEAALFSDDTIDDVLERLPDGMTLIPKPEFAEVFREPVKPFWARLRCRSRHGRSTSGA